MTSEGRHKHSVHPFRKKILRGIIIALLSILFLEFIGYFGFNFFLSNWARARINKSTEEVYEIDFNRINLSLIRRGVFLDGIVLRPVKGQLPKTDQVLFDLTLDEVSFQGFWFDFSDEIFQIGQIRFDNPDIRLILPESELNKNKKERLNSKQLSKVKFLEKEIIKSISQSRINGVLIKEVIISHADLFFLNFLSPNSLHAENTSLSVKNIDLTSREDWKSPFNAEGFEFRLENASFPLPDGVHSIKAGDVRISSLDNHIDIKDFTLIPDYSKESPAYYQVGLHELRIGNVDLNHAFMTSEVEIDEVIMRRPKFNIKRKSQIKRDSTDVATGDLNQLIEGLLQSISVKELDIQKGEFVSSDFLDSLKNRIDIETLDFKMTKFYLGEDESRKRNQFFYGKDAAMEITNASLHLSDEIHRVTGDKVSVSTFKDEVYISNFSIAPIEGNLESKNPKNLINITLPSLVLKETNLQRLYNEGVLELDEMIIIDPKLEIIELYKTEQSIAGKARINDLIDDYMNEVVIGKLSLKNGEVQFKNASGVRSDDVAFEKFSLELDDIYILPNSNTDIRDFVFAEQMLLQLDKYRLKLRDNLHEFLADRVTIDSKNSFLEIINFNIQPEDPGQIQKVLDTYGKTAAVKLHLPLFRAEGIDVSAAFNEEVLHIGKIEVSEPEIGLSTYRVKNWGSAESLTSTSEISELLTQYFSAIQIDSLSFTGGKIFYENSSGDEITTFQEDDFVFNLRGFEVLRGQAMDESRTFFSEEIDLKLNEYSFSLAGGSYEASTGDFNYNSRKQSIQIENLQIIPGEALDSRIALQVNLPLVSMEGVDIEKFLFSNQLSLQNFSLEGGEIELGIDQKIERLKRPALAVTKPSRKSLEIIEIDTIQALNSLLKLNYLSSEKEVQSVYTGFGVSVFDFRLDSVFNSNKDFSSLFREISLSLQDFIFTLPDSVHTLSFSNVIVDNSSDETVFSDFKIRPKGLEGKPGKPIFDLSVEEFGIRNNTLEEIQSSGILNLNRVRITNPVLNVFLDSMKSGSFDPKGKKGPSLDKKFISSILLEDLLFENGAVNLLNKNYDSIPRLNFTGVSFELADLNIDVLNPSSNLNLQFLLEKDLSLSLLDYEIYTKDRLNKLKIGKARYLDSRLVLEDVQFAPALGRYEFLRKKGFQTDVISVNIDKLVLDRIDREAYFSNSMIKAGLLIAENPDIRIFRDKRIPEELSDIREMPQFVMQNFSSDLDLDSIRISNGRIKYEEFGPNSVLPGTIFFEHVDAELYPFVLRSPYKRYPLDSSTLKAQAYLMGSGEIDLNATLYYLYPFPMDVSIRMKGFDLREINDPLSKMVFVGVKSGKVNEAAWNFTLTNEEARGQMIFLYEDLKIDFLDSLTLEKGRGKKNLLSFAANTLLKNDNPRGLFGRTVVSDIYWKRNMHRFIFNAWWKATFSGLKGSVGFGRPKMPIRKEEEE